MLRTFTAISWNLHGVPYFWVSRKARMKTAIVACFQHMPDFIGLQEIWSSSDARFIAQFAQTIGFGSSTGPGGWGRASGGLMFLHSLKRWRLTGSPAFHRYSSHASNLKLYEADGIGQKGILIADLTNKSTGEPISIIVTHLQAQYNHGRTYERVRRLQAAQLDALIQRLPQDRLCLVLGDLNTTPEDLTVYSILTRNCVDLTAEYRAGCDSVPCRRCGTAFDTRTRLEWIDYALASHSSRKLLKSWRIDVIQNDAPDDPYSDHDGLVVTVAEAAADRVAECHLSELLTGAKLLSRRKVIKRIVAASVRARF